MPLNIKMLPHIAYFYLYFIVSEMECAANSRVSFDNVSTHSRFFR